MSKISNWFRNTFLGEPAKAEPADEEAKTEETKDEAPKEQSEESKESKESKEAESTEKPEESSTEETKDEAAKEQSGESKEPEAKPADKVEEPSVEEADKVEFNVEEHLDDFFWYLKAHPIYTKMLLNSSEALGAKPVAIFFNRFTDPQHKHMLVKKDIKEIVKKYFGGDIDKACAEHGGWFYREYRAADAKGNPTDELMAKTPSPEGAPGDGSSGDGDSSAA